METTTNINLNKPARGDFNWDTALNGNFDIVDSLIGNIHANFNTVPEVYIYNGTFNGSTGTDVSLPRVVDSVNEYACKVSATSRAGTIGDIYITKAVDKVTVHCSEANTTDSFSVSIYYVSDAFNDGVSVHRKWFVSPSGEAETDHGDSSTDGTIADIIVNHISGEQSTIELPGRHTYQLRQSFTIPDNVEVVFQKGAIIDTDISIRDGNFEWYASGSGSGEYYLQTSGGGNPNITAPDDVIEDDTQMTAGVVGSLAVGEWAWSDNDGLGYATAYVRLSDGTDPDGKAADYVEAGYDLTINVSPNAGSYQIFSGKVVFGAGVIEKVYLEWWGGKADDSTDNLTPFNDTQDSLSSGGVINLLSGTYQTSEAWNIDTANIEIRGQNKATIIKTTSGTANIIEIGDGVAAAVNHITISGIKFNATGAMTDGSAIAVLGGSYVHIDNIEVAANVYDGVQFAGGAGSYFNVKLTRFDIVASHIGLYFTNDTNEVFIDNGWISTCDYGIYMEYCQGIWMDSVSIYDCNYNAVKMVPGAGEIVQNVFMDEVIGDSSDQHNWVLDGSAGGIYSIHFDSCWASSAGNQTAAYDGIRITGTDVQGLMINNLHCSTNGAHGIKLDAAGSVRITITNGRIWNNSASGANTYDGIYIGAAQTYFTITNNFLGSSAVNQRYPINIAAGASDKYIITGNNLVGNNSEFINDLGTGSTIIVEDNIPRGGGGWGGQDLALADDAVISFTPRYRMGILLVSIDGTNSGMLSYHGIPASAGTLKLAGDAKFTVATGVLTGTTGADLDFTVSAHTDGKIYLENRLGAAKGVDYQVIGGRY